MKDYINNPVETRFSGITLNHDETIMFWQIMKTASNDKKTIKAVRDFAQKIADFVAQIDFIYIDESPF